MYTCMYDSTSTEGHTCSAHIYDHTYTYQHMLTCICTCICMTLLVLRVIHVVHI